MPTCYNTGSSIPGNNSPQAASLCRAQMLLTYRQCQEVQDVADQDMLSLIAECIVCNARCIFKLCCHHLSHTAVHRPVTQLLLTAHAKAINMRLLRCFGVLQAWKQLLNSWLHSRRANDLADQQLLTACSMPQLASPKTGDSG